ncbi:MAG: N-acetylmuramoyl-L-alanine amidase [bacterium]|nr:N-acetylmuramoyl-L-alanine amidase [bacterium]
MNMTKPWIDPLIIKPKRRVSKVFIHCSDSNYKTHDNVATIRKWHVKENGWPYVGYHWIITRNGVIHDGRPLRLIPAAQAPHNTGSLAFCVTGRDWFTAEQMAAALHLCLKLDDLYSHAVTFHGHKEVANKLCPVFKYRAVLALDESGHMRRA